MPVEIIYAADTTHIVIFLIKRIPRSSASGYNHLSLSIVIPACRESFFKKDSGQARMTDFFTSFS